MREIKFRGYDGADWIYGSAVRYDSYTDTWYMIENGDPDDDWVMVGNIGQYTGLKDKNDKEIYEGMVYHQGDPRITYTVVWRDTGLIGKQNGSGSYAGLSYWQDKIEVIGNIYEEQIKD